MKTIYQLTKWHKDSVHPDEQTVGFYESWKDANLEKRSLELNNFLHYEYMIYTCKVIAKIVRGAELMSTEDLEDTVKYFNACAEKQKEINKLIEIVTLAENYMSCDKDDRDSIDFLNALYEYRGDNEGNCPSCKQGTVKELSIYDNWEGMLTCDKCGVRAKT